MFGFSFGELVMICVVALVFVGPRKLPGVLRSVAQWLRKARNMVHDMRAQSGIDDLLRAEGLHGGIHELRSLVRGGGYQAPAYVPSTPPEVTPSPAPEPPSPYSREPVYGCVDIDPTKEYPPEGPDAYGALPDDLFDEPYPLPAGAPLEPGPTELAAARDSAPDESAPPAQSAPAA